jgi:uncharacterized protein
MLMKEFIEFIAKSLVDEPDQVRADELFEDNRIIVKLHVSKKDLGKVIGKQGKTARSMRTLFTAVAAKNNKSGHLEIMEANLPDTSHQPAQQ